ncbi:MAG TPA: alpha-E domain-containing protein [Saprospiraceae bacterium]|nr:alpha-E domain-containing protein [Saprospiraceae bacterium]HMQ81666.1 alpha-E domain-containing protein [Saprospiraceae bacterium]
MLARVAESLYWMGRSLERVEHCSRYLKVQYYSTLDAPMSQNKDFTLRSILFMSGSNLDVYVPIHENYVWQKVISDPNNPNSLFQLSHNARENARSIRNSISSELWEAINKWYLYIRDLEINTFNSSDIFSFAENATIHLAIIKSAIATTLLHNDVWSFINLGIYLERSMQVLRIVRSKLSDSIILSNNGANIPLLQYQWTTLLKSLEAFDVYKNQNRGVLSREAIFALVLDNGLFPRSLKYSSKKVRSHLAQISVRPVEYEAVIEIFEDKMNNCLNFSDYSNEEEVLSRISEAIECLSNFHYDIQQLYFQ